MATLSRLRDAIGGLVIAPGDEGYDDARRVWNGMIDRRPAAIVRARDAGDVAPAIRAARELGLPLAIRGGGHNVAGHGTVEGGIVLDLGGLTDVRVDPDTRRMRVAAGATLGHIDRATEPHGLAVPAGVISGTGVAGLTLGGGIGWLTRPYGLTIDNFLEADVVTAAGEAVHASPIERSDLFWALRGGGGNFGVVTSFLFRAVPLGPDVFAGTFVYGRERWVDALRAWDAWGADLPDPMTSIATFLVPRPDFELGDDPVMLIAWLWASPDRSEGERIAGRLRGAAPPDRALVQPTSWTAWQSQADGLFPRGVRSYWKNTSFDRLDEATIGVIVKRALEQTWSDTGFDLHHLGGAFGRVPLADTPFPNRSARYWLNIYGFWSDPADDADRIAFVRGFAADMEPLASGGRYVNFLGAEDDLADPRSAALAVFGPEKLLRLADVKRRYDPDNVFRLTHPPPPG